MHSCDTRSMDKSGDQGVFSQFNGDQHFPPKVHCRVLYLLRWLATRNRYSHAHLGYTQPFWWWDGVERCPRREVTDLPGNERTNWLVPYWTNPELLEQKCPRSPGLLDTGLGSDTSRQISLICRLTFEYLVRDKMTTAREGIEIWPADMKDKFFKLGSNLRFLSIMFQYQKLWRSTGYQRRRKVCIISAGFA